MSRRKSNDLVNLILVFVFLIYFLGFKETLNLIYEMLKMINMILMQLANTFVLTSLFKYCIAFPIVGLILTAIGSPRGKEGHIIGKILYFIVGYIIGFILDYVSALIF